MRDFLILPALAAAFATLNAAPLSEAERCVRDGNPLAALEALQAKGDALSAEDCFWKGQALVRLKRYEEGASVLARVPDSHPLYSYAARAIIFCAWKSPRINFLEALGHIRIQHDDALAQLVIASMSEYQLKATQNGDLSAFLELKRMAGQNPDLIPIIKVLSIQEFRRNREYNEGIAYAKKLEHDTALSPQMRQRVRLELADLYYDKEKYAPAAEQDTAVDQEEGIGEETLLQFITANPKSPLLEEAFRRLYRRSNGASSEYTREKLQIWINDTAHPHRAALAILYKLFQNNITDGEKEALVNSAAADLPGEPLTHTILDEYLRELFSKGRDEEARRYLNLLDSQVRSDNEAARALFFRAFSQRNDPARAMDLFCQSARLADGQLQPAAITNALICSMRCGNKEMAERLLAIPLFITSKRALHLAYAGLVQKNAPERARDELNGAENLRPTPEQAVDIRLDRAQLALRDDPAGAYASLRRIHAQERATWTDAQMLRYAALLEKAADLQTPPEDGEPEKLLYMLYKQAADVNTRRQLGMHLAARLSRHGKGREALNLLLGLERQLSPGIDKAAAALRAGYEASRLGTQEDLAKAVALYAECARMNTPLTPMALIEQASILVRINRTQEAFALLEQLEASPFVLSAEEKAHCLTVKADAFGYDLEQHSREALEACEQVLDIPNLPLAWKLRARLQHACFSTRLNDNEKALADYLKVMEEMKADAQARGESPDGYIYYYAGAGAVYELLCLHRANDAACLAESMNADAEAASSPKAADTAAAFANWARDIRKQHFLPMPD